MDDEVLSLVGTVTVQWNDTGAVVVIDRNKETGAWAACFEQAPEHADEWRDTFGPRSLRLLADIVDALRMYSDV